MSLPTLSAGTDPLTWEADRVIRDQHYTPLHPSQEGITTPFTKGQLAISRDQLSEFSLIRNDAVIALQNKS